MKIYLLGTKGEMSQVVVPDSNFSSGTCLQSRIDCTYSELVKAFGEPTHKGDGYKTDAEWDILTPFGVCTVYNYKDGQNYNGANGLAVEDITDWHLGGFDKRSAEAVVARIRSTN